MVGAHVLVIGGTGGACSAGRDAAVPNCYVALRPAGRVPIRLRVAAGDPPPLVWWLRPSSLHLTIAYLDWLDRAQIRSLARRLRTLAVPRQLTLTGVLCALGSSPDRMSLVARVCWEPSLRRHRAEVLAAVRAVGGSVAASRRFVPHVTLARLPPGSAGHVSRWRLEPTTIALRDCRLIAGITTPRFL